MFISFFAFVIVSVLSAEGAVPQRLRPQCRANVCDDRPECPRTSCRCLFASRMDCAVYYQCVNGKPYQYRCSPGLLFNAETLTCDYSTNVNCSIGTSPSPEVLNTTSSILETTRLITTTTIESNNKTTTVFPSTRNVETTTYEPSSRKITTEIATTAESPTTSKETTTQSVNTTVFITTRNIETTTAESSTEKEAETTTEIVTMTESPDTSQEITTDISTTETEIIPSKTITESPETEETQTEKLSTTVSDVVSTTVSITTSTEEDTSTELTVTEITLTNSSTVSSIRYKTEEKTTPYQVLTTTIPSTEFICLSRFGLFPDPKSCFRFYHCSHWVPYHKWCPSNLHFNPKLKVCDWPYRAGCETSDMSTSIAEISSTINPETPNGTCDCDCCELPVPDDCSAYILCIDRVAFRMHCSTDLYFNPRTGTCDFQENVQCAINDVICQEPFGRFLYPGSCSYFVECRDGKKATRKCPEGLYFNQTSEMCSWTGSCSDDKPKPPTDSKTVVDNLICNGCSYCFKPVQSDCSRYVRCFEDLATEERCAAGLYFNPATQLCDHDYNVECPGPEPGLECPQKYGYFAYPGECNKYLHCVDGSATVKSCPGVLHFDPVKKHCDWPWVAGCGGSDVSPTPEPEPEIISCDCDCCLKPTGDDCRSFILCIGQVGFKRSCSSGLFFNPQTENCDFAENVNCTVTPDEPNNVCPEYQGLFPYPEDCRKFIHCAHGIPHIKNCPSDLHFNPQLKVCDWPYSAGCQSFPSIPPPTEDDDFPCDICDSCFIPDANDCSSYIYCRSGKGYRLRCTENLLFNPEIEACDLANNVKCPNKPDSQCPKPDGLFPAKDCGQFIHCSNGIAYLKDCPDGLHFNVQTLVCDWPENAKCGEIPVVPTKPDDNIDIFNQTCDCDCCFLPDPKDCSKYYLCLDGYVYEGQCSRGLLFNPNIQNCDLAERVTCGEISPLCPQPNGLFPNPSDCSSFIRCSNGKPETEYCKVSTHFSAQEKQCLDPCEAKCDLTYDCSTTSSVVISSTPEFSICTEPEGFYPALNDCTSYYICVNGQSQLVKCPTGLHYNAEYEVCEDPCDAKCNHSLDCSSPSPELSSTISSSSTIDDSTVSPICVIPNDFYPVEDDCSAFYQCSHGRPYKMACPRGLHFSAEDLICEHPCLAGCDPTLDCSSPSTMTTTPSSSTHSPYCPNGQDGLFPSDDDCGSFYQCTDGRAYLMKCPGGLHFSYEHQVCERPCIAKCNKTIDCISTTTAEPSSPSTPTTLPPECLESNGLFPNPDDCGSFYQCSNSKSHLIRCPSGLHFNLDDAACERPCVAGCNKSIDCSVTTPKPDVSTLSPHCPTSEGLYPVAGDCTAFYLCSNGKEHLIRCPPGLHYSEEAKTCENPCDARCNVSIDCISTTTPEPSSPSTPTPLPPECLESNGLFQNPDDCGSFYQCSNGKSHLIRCPSGLHFNVDDAACERPCVAGCNKSIDCSITTPKPTSSTHSPHCPTAEGIYPVPGDCSAFYLCSNGKEHLIHCPPGLHYSEKDEICENPCDAQCNVTTDCISTTTTESSSSSTPEPLPPECLESNGLFPNPDDCGSFYQCSNGRSHLILCPSGLHFSIDDAACERPCVAGCDISIVCPTEIPDTEGNCTCEACYLPDPDDCSAFYFCSNRRLTKGYCPYGMLFDKISSQCKEEDVVNCETNGDPSMCPEPFGFFPYPGECKKFLHCENSVAHIRECEGNLEYDPQSKVCTKPKGYCGDVVPDPHCPEPTGLFPDPENCSIFYHCENGVAYTKRCSSPLLFNPAKDVCDWPENVNCGKDMTTPLVSSPSAETSSLSTLSTRQSTPSETPSPSTHISSTTEPCYEVPGVVCPCACRVPTYDDCSSFFQCQEDGTACKKYCPEGLYFNKREMVCDLPSNLECREFFFTTMRRSKHLSQQSRASSPKS